MYYIYTYIYIYISVKIKAKNLKFTRISSTLIGYLNANPPDF